MMNKDDDFDQFLQSEFRKAESKIADEGFTQQIVSKLPMQKLRPKKRNYILYLSSIIPVFIFFISSGYKSLLISLIDLFNNGFHLVKPSFISLFVISVFISISCCIAWNEYNKNTI